MSFLCHLYTFSTLLLCWDLSFNTIIKSIPLGNLNYFSDLHREACLLWQVNYIFKAQYLCSQNQTQWSVIYFFWHLFGPLLLLRHNSGRGYFMAGFFFTPFFFSGENSYFSAWIKVDLIIFSALFLLLFPQQLMKAYKVTSLSGESDPFHMEFWWTGSWIMM